MIKNIVYDFGYVLAYPRSGNWFIPLKARQILGLRNCLLFILRFYKVGSAFYKAYKYLNDNHLLFTEEEELLQFTEFYNQILIDLGINKDRGVLAELLAKDTVLNDDKVIFYGDVLEELKRAHISYKVAVLSDTWPSLKRLFDHKGITELLDGLIMSCDYGICKDNIELFHKAAAALKIEPAETAFIDDSEANLDNAYNAGFLPIRINRNKKAVKSKYTVVHNLKEAYEIVESKNIRFPGKI